MCSLGWAQSFTSSSHLILETILEARYTYPHIINQKIRLQWWTNKKEVIVIIVKINNAVEIGSKSKRS